MGILFGDSYYENNYNYSGPSKVDVTHGPITVNENKAPTDASAKLLLELQEQAIKNIIGKLKTDDNIFHATGMLFKNNQNLCYDIVTKYTINKQERVVIVSIDEFEIKDIETCMKKIIKAVADDFAQMVVGQSYITYWHDLCAAVYKKGV